MIGKTIFTSFFTTISKNSCLQAIQILLSPAMLFNMNNGKYANRVKKKLLRYIFQKRNNKSKIIGFYNARSAIFGGLQVLEIGSGDEILVQGYTCVSVINSIIQGGITPVYVDIDQTLNMDPNQIESKITKKTKAIMIQHTFGNPANIYKIKEICTKHNLYLIEDCAQSLGAEYDNKKVGTFGDISIFSFGRDKIISTTNGGFLVINNPNFFHKKDDIEKSLKNTPINIILQNLFYIIISYISYKSYDFFGLGKLIIATSKRFGIIPKIINNKEKSCENNDLYYKYPNILAKIGLLEIDNIDIFNKRRQEIAEIYNKQIYAKSVNNNINSINIFLRYIIFVDNPNDIIKNTTKHGIFLGDWYQQVIAPKDTNIDKTLYLYGSCPVAEELSNKTINLPCHPIMTNKDINRVIRTISQYI